MNLESAHLVWAVTWVGSNRNLSGRPQKKEIEWPSWRATACATAGPCSLSIQLARLLLLLILLLGCLGNQRLTTTEWKDIAKAKRGVCSSRFFELMNELEDAGKVAKSMTDDKWQQIRENSGNWSDEKDQ